jgi:sulfatase maturation enzyme AslB (radical SAM superfamily)
VAGKSLKRGRQPRRSRPQILIAAGKGPSPLQTHQILQAWGKILKGEPPSLSIEITRECPLKCPGCYAYDEDHLGGKKTLRELNDYRGQALVDGVLKVVDRLKPLHLSIVGGDPLVRFRELEELIPPLLSRGIHVQIVTSAFRKMGPTWAKLPNLNVCVSIDGLQPEHDARRAPATYDRILANIADQFITIHCTITGQMMKRPGYLAEFLEFWTPRPQVRRVWFSLFTPQVGDQMPEILSPKERASAIAELIELRKDHPKLNMSEGLIRQFASPPHNPEDCVFALTTQTLSADLETKITPCQFGGTPDCASCGCIATMALSALAGHKLAGVLPVGTLFKGSIRIGQNRARSKAKNSTNNPLHVLQVRSDASVTKTEGEIGL